MDEITLMCSAFRSFSFQGISFERTGWFSNDLNLVFQKVVQGLHLLVKVCAAIMFVWWLARAGEVNLSSIHLPSGSIEPWDPLKSQRPHITVILEGWKILK